VVVLTPVTAAAARTRIRCHDGDPTCDSDQTRDGKCTFNVVLHPSRRYACCCGGGCRCACPAKVVRARVKVHGRRVVKTHTHLFGSVLLRCLP